MVLKDNRLRCRLPEEVNGQYLFDRDGARYLDLLSGFGVFAIGRNHPALRQALKSVLDSDLPNLVQLDVSDAGRRTGRAPARTSCPIWTRCSLPIPGAECVEAAIKFARGATGRPGIVYCASCVPRPVLRRAVAHRRSELPRRVSSRCCPDAHQIPFNDLAALERALSSRAGRRLYRRADPGQGRQSCPSDELSAGRGARSAANTARCSSPTKFRPASAAPAGSSRSSTGTSNPTWSCSRRRCPAAMFRSARC